MDRVVSHGEKPSGLGVRLAVGALRVYQVAVSPLLGPRCRFYPSCSAYAGQALIRHGVYRGLFLAAWRLLRCHPFSKGGIDNVPHLLETHPQRACCDHES